MSAQMQLFEAPAKKLSKCAVYEVQLVRTANTLYTREKINNTAVAVRVVAELVRPFLENAPAEKFLIAKCFRPRC